MAQESAIQLESLAFGIKRCEQCRLHESRHHAVPGEGPTDAELVFIGEGPGGKEDKLGRPFVGPAGQFLDVLLRDNGIDRRRAFITNCVKCRPPENRTPRRDELNACQSLWLNRQLALLSPRLIVLLGQVATQQMLGNTVSVTRWHGTVRRHGGRDYFISYHPAAALRFDSIAHALRADFGRLREWLAAEPTEAGKAL
jgi:DNA polymerase